MTDDRNQLNSDYDDQGYFVIRDYFNVSEISSLRKIILKFHALWKHDNADFYQQEAFNSSLITGSKYLEFDERVMLFNFISSKKIMHAVDLVISANPAFMNTQLFFNPVPLIQSKKISGIETVNMIMMLKCKKKLFMTRK